MTGAPILMVELFVAFHRVYVALSGVTEQNYQPLEFSVPNHCMVPVVCMDCRKHLPMSTLDCTV